MKNFDSSNSTFRQLFANGLAFRVPAFQRDYAWTADEWDDLWQDLLALSADPESGGHYLGYLVLQATDNKHYDIIDGQQRLTTISILILAGLGHLQDLCESGMDSENNAKRQEQLRNSYIGYLDPVSLVTRSKLELNRHNNRFYQTYLVTLEKPPYLGLNASELGLRQAFHWFKEKIITLAGNDVHSGRKTAAFIDDLVDRLFFTVITVSDELNAFKVFETLNARGVRLSAADLLKNYLFSLASTQNTHESELGYLEERWERIVGLMGSESLPEFLRVFWNSRHKSLRKSELFKAIREHIGSRRQVFELLRQLDQDAAVYAALLEPQESLWLPQERKALELLRLFDGTQHMALLLACHRHWFENERAAFTRLLKMLAALSFRYNVICGLQAQELERHYNDMARKLFAQEYGRPAELLGELARICPDDARFKAAFSEKELQSGNSRNKKLLRYMLFEIERQISGNDLEAESAKYSIEHILPEHPAEHWGMSDQAKLKRMVYKIGNMTLLETSVNRELGNAGYEEKRKAYAASVFQMTRAINEHYDEWNEGKIAARQRKLAALAASIWKIEA